MSVMFVVRDPSGRQVASNPSDWAALVNKGINTTGYSVEASGRPIQYFSDTNGKVTTNNYVAPNQQTQPTALPPVAPPSIVPGGGPVTPDQNIQPLPNIPGLSNPQTPVNTATVPGTDISPYIPVTSQQQQDIINHAIQQSQTVANQNVQSLQDVLNPYVMSQIKNWTDPNSADYQATMGNLNNFGRADAGTFGQSLASRLAPLIGENMMSLGTNALTPSFQNQQNLVTSGAGTQSNLGLASLQRFIDLQNFDKQAALSNQLADKGIPSGVQQGIGTGSSLLSGIGNFMQGLPGLKQVAGGTWICTHLKKLGLATEAEVEAVHARLRPTIVSHPIDWLRYVLFAPRLIVLADEASVDWQVVKKVLIDAVLEEPDAEKAFQIYRTEVHLLCDRYAPELWKLEIA